MDGAIKIIEEVTPRIKDCGLVLVLVELVIDVLKLHRFAVIVICHPADAVREHPLKWDGILRRLVPFVRILRLGNGSFNLLSVGAAYVVLQYLLKYSDENNTKSAYDIIGYWEDCGISAERRSIYRDIEDINRIMLMLQEDIDLDEADRMFAEAEESGDEEELNELKTVLYDKNKKGFYVRQRKFEVSDMRLLAECVYAAKFIAEGQAKRLVDVICDFVSEKQADRIKHNAFLTDRVKRTIEA